MPTWEKMMIVLALVIFVPCVVGIVIGLAAPEGYEDENGYHDVEI